MSFVKTATTLNGAEINRLAPDDRAVHDWYRFILSYPPHLVREYLQRFQVGIDLFRTRAATATREQLREEVVMLKWPGKRHQ